MPVYFICGFLILIASCATGAVETITAANHQGDTVDAFIKVSRINSQAVLILFGSDAVTAIHTGGGIVVIDAGISSGLTSKYREIIEREFNGAPFRYIINTHAHPDHYGGNSVFPEAEVVGHENCAVEMDFQWKDTTKAIQRLARIVEEYAMQMQGYPEKSKDWVEAYTQKTRYYEALADARSKDFVRKPSLTFSDSLLIDMGDVTFEMKYFGKCHSESDVLIYVPELKMLFSGDLFFKYGRPGINEKYIENKEKWLQAAAWIEDRLPGIETVVSGHGTILTKEDLAAFANKVKAYQME